MVITDTLVAALLILLAPAAGAGAAGAVANVCGVHAYLARLEVPLGAVCDGSGYCHRLTCVPGSQRV